MFLAACGESGPSEPVDQPLPVAVLEAAPQTLPMMLEAVGQAEGSKDFEVRARVGGILEKQFYVEGDRVAAGAPLFRIDPAPYQAAYDQAKAGLEQAQREVERLRPLVERRTASRKEFDDASTQLQTAEARAREAALNLTYSTVTAPFAGITGRSAQSLGTLVSPTGNSLLTTITQADPLWVRFSISDAEYPKLRNETRQSSVRLILPDGSTYGEKGHLNFTGSTVDPTLGAVQMRAEFPNPQLLVLPGQYVRVQVMYGSHSVVLVPQPAVIQGDQGPFVWVVDEHSKAAPRSIETSGWSDSNWVVTGGLAAGDKVVVDNIIKIRPGAALAPHSPGADSAASGKTAKSATSH